MNGKGLDEEIIGTYHIVTNDNKEIKIDNTIINSSKLLTTLKEDTKGTKFNINVPSNIMNNIIEYILHYSNSYPVYKKYATYNLENDVTSWDINFLKKTPKKLLEIYNASHYLDIKPLCKLLSIYFAHFIKKKTPDEIIKCLE